MFHKKLLATYSNFSKKGFTLLELMIVVVIITLLVTIIWISFSKINQNQALDKSVREVVSIMNDARQRTLFSKNNSNYGVHFETDRIVLFKGNSYNANDGTNEVIVLNNLVNLSSISLTGGGSEVIFNRLSGDTSKSGTIVYALTVPPNTSKTITISTTGIIEISN